MEYLCSNTSVFGYYWLIHTLSNESTIVPNITLETNGRRICLSILFFSSKLFVIRSTNDSRFAVQARGQPQPWVCLFNDSFVRSPGSHLRQNLRRGQKIRLCRYSEFNQYYFWTTRQKYVPVKKTTCQSLLQSYLSLLCGIQRYWIHV